MPNRCRYCWRNQVTRGTVCANCKVKRRQWRHFTIEEKRAHQLEQRPRTGNGYTVTINLRSNNTKTGKIPVSMTDQASCPPTCSFYGYGCYAEYAHIGWHWRNAAKGLDWDAFCGVIAKLPAGTLWRHNEAGDLPGRGTVLDYAALHKLVVANRGKRGFTFTHKPLLNVGEQFAVRKANRSGFTINLSADSLEHADRLMAMRIGPVAVVLPHNVMDHSFKTPAGHTVVVCPAETHDLQCKDCQLCAKADRKSIVGFRAHGQARTGVTQLVQLGRKSTAA